jgi:exodeoxyribonuclease V alpha subunit
MKNEARTVLSQSSSLQTVTTPSNTAPVLILNDIPLGKQFADYLCRLENNSNSEVAWAARLVCLAVAEGLVCLRLDEYAGKSIRLGENASPILLPSLEKWEQSLRQSRLVGKPDEYTPLILEANHYLYLARYWAYEKNLADRLLALAANPCQGIDIAQLRTHLDHLFLHNTGQPDHQKLAAAVAVLQQFCVISGGPGTGKTSTVIRILAALHLHMGGAALRIALSAPTGKAAARLQEAMREQKSRLNLSSELLAILPETACTLHRLLGAKPDSVSFRHHRQNPLPLDVLVVDEASMIDLALMAKLVDALPIHARLILLGDKDQLSSVEAGSVFGDLCIASGYSLPFCDQLYAASGIKPMSVDLFVPALADCVAILTRSHRFGAKSGIGELARLINEGRTKAALKLLTSGYHADIVWDQGRSRVHLDLLERMEQGYRTFLEAIDGDTDPREVLRLFGNFRVFTAHRKGMHGTEGINGRFEEYLFAKRRIRSGTRWYCGRPVIMVSNDYDLRLFNGDIGIALKCGSELRVFFEDADGRIRSFSPGRLPEHETVYAMTVHKSQGSEFAEIVLVLPDHESPVVNRPLIYTAITRAKQRVEIRSSRAVLEKAIGNLPRRSSGLRERLAMLPP